MRDASEPGVSIGAPAVLWLFGQHLLLDEVVYDGPFSAIVCR